MLLWQKCPGSLLQVFSCESIYIPFSEKHAPVHRKTKNPHGQKIMAVSLILRCLGEPGLFPEVAVRPNWAIWGEGCY